MEVGQFLDLASALEGIYRATHSQKASFAVLGYSLVEQNSLKSIYVLTEQEQRSAEYI